MELTNRDECIALLSQRLTSLRPEARSAAFLIELSNQFESDSTNAQSPAGFGLTLGHWIVRDDDLKLMDELNRALLAAAGVGFFMDSKQVTAAAWTGVAIAILSLLRNAARASAKLTDDELTVLWAIKQAVRRPTTSDLLGSFAGKHTSGGDTWDRDRLERTLGALKDYPTRAGVKHFVAQGGDGGWVIEGV